MDSKMELFRKNDTTLVYIASAEFAKEITSSQQQYDFDIYIHVGCDKGSVSVYGDNDIKNIIPIDMKTREYILKLAEKDR